MTYEKAIERIQKSGVIADWTWSQQKWDETAKLYIGKNFLWKKSLVQLGGFIFVLALMNVGRIISEGPYEAERLPFSYYLPWLSLAAFLLFGFFLFYQWFQKNYFPTPRISDNPQIILSREGVILGRRSFFWESPATKISKIELVTPETAMYPYTLQLEIAWGMGIGEIIIPVPDDKLPEAQQVLNVISEWSKNQKYGSLLQ